MSKKTKKSSPQHELSSLCFNSCAEWKLTAKINKTNSNIVN